MRTQTKCPNEGIRQRGKDLVSKLRFQRTWRYKHSKNRLMYFQNISVLYIYGTRSGILAYHCRLSSRSAVLLAQFLDGCLQWFSIDHWYRGWMGTKPKRQSGKNSRATDWVCLKWICHINMVFFIANISIFWCVHFLFLTHFTKAFLSPVTPCMIIHRRFMIDVLYISGDMLGAFLSKMTYLCR